MGRIRTIKPEFPQSETVGRLSRDARLLFIQLWTIVDDEGRARAASRMLASLLYPYDDDAPRLIDTWLAELAREKCIVRYVVEGSTYIEIINFGKHQKIDHATKSKLPAFEPSSEPSEILASVIEPSETLAPDLGSVSRIKEEDICPEPDKPVRTRNAYPDDFEKWWSSYPTDPNMSKSDAAKAWSKLSSEDRVAAAAAVPGFVAYCRKNPDYRPVHAVKFITSRRFDGFAKPQQSTASLFDDPTDPTIDFRGGYKSRLSLAVKARVDGTWDRTNWGPPPGEPGCRVPERFLPAFSASAAQDRRHAA